MAEIPPPHCSQLEPATTKAALCQRISSPLIYQKLWDIYWTDFRTDMSEIESDIRCLNMIWK